MKRIITIARWYNNYHYQIDRIDSGEESLIITRNTDKSPFGVISVIRFPFVEGSFLNPFMNWENLIRCSNYYGLPPEETVVDIEGYTQLGYMMSAVQTGKKPAATIRYPIDDPLVKTAVLHLPDHCLVLPYQEENTTFICRKGSLIDCYNNFFNLQQLQKLYSTYCIGDIDWKTVQSACEVQISDFSDSELSGILIERGSQNNTEHVIVGLLLGYPIESTDALIHGTYENYCNHCYSQAKKHFKVCDDPYSDAFHHTWIKDGDNIFINGQQESNYY